MPLIAVLATLLEVVTVGLLKVASRMITPRGREYAFLVRYQDRPGVLKEVLARSAELVSPPPRPSCARRSLPEA